MPSLLKAPAQQVALALTNTVIVMGEKRFTLTGLTPRDNAHCGSFRGRVLFKQPRPDAAIHNFRGTQIFFLAAGPDYDMQAIQVNQITLEDGTVISGCKKVSAYLSLPSNTTFTAFCAENEITLIPSFPT